MISPAQPPVLRLVAWAEGFTRAAAWFSLALLFAAILVTVVDVAARRTIGWTVVGLVDLTQLFVMSFVFFAIPFGFMRDANVSVDFLTDRLPPRGLALVKGLCALLGFAFMIGVTWYSAVRAAQQVENGDASQTIGIPFAWYWVPLLIGCGLSALAALLQAGKHFWAAATGRGEAAPPLA